MKTISNNTVSNLVNQFTLSNLTTERAYIIGEGWQDVKIDESFKLNAINSIVDLIGGRQNTKDRIKFVIRNNPVHSWFADRIVFDAKQNKWSYIAGQDYPGEIKDIRRQLTTKF